MADNVIGFVRHHKIIALAKANKLSIVIKWNTELAKWAAGFENTMMVRPGTIDGDIGILTEALGYGATPDESIENLSKKIKDQVLVVEPFGGSKNRRRVHVLL